MAEFNFTRLNRLVMLYRVVQVLLLLLLAGVAFSFQTHYPGHFFISLIASLVIQGILLYPLYRLAWHDSGVEFNNSSTTLSEAETMGLRKKRLYSDLGKISLLLFFIIFIAKIPEAKKIGTPFFLSTSLYVFLLVFLTYFQCFNYSVKKRLASHK